MIDLPEDYTLSFKKSMFTNRIECFNDVGNKIEIPGLKTKIDAYITHHVNTNHKQVGKGSFMLGYLCSSNKIMQVKNLDKVIANSIDDFENFLCSIEEIDRI